MVADSWLALGPRTPALAANREASMCEILSDCVEAANLYSCGAAEDANTDVFANMWLQV